MRDRQDAEYLASPWTAFIQFWQGNVTVWLKTLAVASHVQYVYYITTEKLWENRNDKVNAVLRLEVGKKATNPVGFYLAIQTRWLIIGLHAHTITYPRICFNKYHTAMKGKPCEQLQAVIKLHQTTPMSSMD